MNTTRLTNRPLARSPLSIGLELGLTLALALAAGCSSSNSTTPPAATLPTFANAGFSSSTSITNAYFPLIPGTAHLYLGTDGSDHEQVIVEVTDDTRLVAGVLARVVRDRVFEGDLLIEDTRDWFAQDDAGNVWYLGEEVDNFEYDADDNLIGVDHEGSWEAGLDVSGIGSLAVAGIQMLANPTVGTTYAQEFYDGEAEDMGEIVALSVSVTLADGTTVACLQTRDFTPLEPGVSEHKFYAPLRGLVREEQVGASAVLEILGTFDRDYASVPDFGAATFSNPSTITNPFAGFRSERAYAYFVDAEDPEIIIIELLEGTRTILGIECAIVQDRVFLDGELLEDTRDWYAQDDAGNVWYMGEEVDNYEYDDDGNLLGINHDGSWEAGLDIAGTGNLAEPGYLAPASPQPGTSYYQEWYEGEAEDMGYVVAVDVEVELDSGLVFTGCLQTLDWNPLDPAGIEYKYFAPGIGLILEEKPAEDEVADLRGIFDLGRSGVPNFFAASFNDSAFVDHPLAQFLSPNTFAYESQTADGLEEILVEVSAVTRVVAGVECAVVREREWLDGVIQEDTEDWYAQDDDGNVWYMGEAVLNYRYDDDGLFLGTDTAGSWEAGLDVAGTGSLALPGYLLPANPTRGQAYAQEIYPEEAEDLAVILAIDEELQVGATLFEHCVRTLEWNPLDAGHLETKVYAPGVGLIFEEALGEDEPVLLVSTFP